MPPLDHAGGGDAPAAAGLTVADVVTVLSLSFWTVWPCGPATAVRLTAVAALMALARLRISEIAALLFEDWPKDGRRNFFFAEYHGVRRPVPITPELRFIVDRYLRQRPKTSCPCLFVTSNGMAMTSTMMRIPLDRVTMRLKLTRPLHRMLMAFCTNAHLGDRDGEAAAIIVSLPRGKGRHAPRVGTGRLVAAARRCNPLRPLRPVFRRPALLARIRQTHPVTMPATWKDPPKSWPPRARRRCLTAADHPAIAELAAARWPQSHAGRKALRDRLFAAHFRTVHTMLRQKLLTLPAAAALFGLSPGGYAWRASSIMEPDAHRDRKRKSAKAQRKAGARRRGEAAAARARETELTPGEAAVLADLAGAQWPPDRRAFLAQRRELLTRHLDTVRRLVDEKKVSNADMAMVFRLHPHDMATQIRQARQGLVPRLLREHPRAVRQRDMIAVLRAALPGRPAGDTDMALHRRLRGQGFRRCYATMRIMLAGIRREP